jgi:hypothetical protein
MLTSELMGMEKIKKRFLGNSFKDSLKPTLTSSLSVTPRRKKKKLFGRKISLRCDQLLCEIDAIFQMGRVLWLTRYLKIKFDEDDFGGQGEGGTIVVLIEGHYAKGNNKKRGKGHV